MTIYLTSGEGHGNTPLSAFDAALQDAGVANYNLIILSSIIPPDSKIVEKKFNANPLDFGKRLYAVKAEMRSRESGKYVGAALGWYELPNGSGLFVEHEEVAETEVAVRSSLEEDVRKSLKDLCKFRKIPFVGKNMKTKMQIAHVDDSPTCALVLAVYKVENW